MPDEVYGAFADSLPERANNRDEKCASELLALGREILHASEPGKAVNRKKISSVAIFHSAVPT
jgi:hypothetical protein